MKAVFLCRDGLVARYVAHELHGEHPLSAIVTESGRDARRRKLRRTWRRIPWWRAPGLALDLLALTIYGRAWERTLERRLADRPASDGYPDDVERFAFHDANQPECIELLGRLGPDVLVVLGTSILGPSVLAIPREAALNIHGGIVPQYRNVHSEVWAVLRGGPGEVGTSILHLDEGIDSGAVALQERVDPPSAAGFFELRWRNVELAARLAREALQRLHEGSLPREPQDASDAGFHPTPGARELVRLWLRELSRTSP